MSLPPEICALICQELLGDTASLLALSRVSRSFRGEAERLMYLSVSLRTKRNFKSFCLAVIRRPHLVRRLHTLVMIMPPPMDLEIADLERITKMLRLSTHLQHLRVLSDAPAVPPQPTPLPLFPPFSSDAVPTWIIEGHPFQLKSFENSYFEQAMIWRFLRLQPSIETLIMNSGALTLNGTPLPNLKNLSCCSESLQGLNSPSQPDGCIKDVERLQLFLVKASEEEHLMMLARIRGHLRRTLRALSISRFYCRPAGMRMDLLLYTIADQVPELKYLRILDYSTETETQLAPFLAGIPIAFTQLHTLILRPAMLHSPSFAPSPSSPPPQCACKELRTASGRREAAARAKDALPTLRRVVFVIDAAVYEYTVREDEDGSGFCCTECSMLCKAGGEMDGDEWLTVDL